MSRKVIALLAVVLAQLGWSGYGVIVNKFNSNLEPFLFCFYRDLFCSPLLMIVAAMVEGIKIPTLKQIPAFLGLGFFLFMNQFLYLQGNFFTSADIASAMQPLIPVFTAVMAVVTGLEARPDLLTVKGWAKIVGTLVSAGGAAVIVIFGEKAVTFAVSDNHVLGYLCLLGNTLSMAAYVIIQKKFIFPSKDSSLVPNASGLVDPLMDVSVEFENQVVSNGAINHSRFAVDFSEWEKLCINVTAWTYVSAALFMSLGSTYYLFTGQYSVFSISLPTLIPLSYAVFVSSAICFGIISYCNTQLPASIVTASWPLQVLFTVILSLLVLGENMNPLQFVGGGMIAAGLLMVTYGRS
jgi:drug/metabolite transporter (DMT)-like permease